MDFHILTTEEHLRAFRLQWLHWTDSLLLWVNMRDGKRVEINSVTVPILEKLR